MPVHQADKVKPDTIGLPAFRKPPEETFAILVVKEYPAAPTAPNGDVVDCSLKLKPEFPCQAPNIPSRKVKSA